MKRTPALPVAFALLVAFGTWRHLEASAAAAPSAVVQSIAAQRGTLALGSDGGSFPAEWIHGADCSTEPAVQVHAYDADTYLIRQGHCQTFEAPFLFLLMGEDAGLLMDTGANPSTNLARPVRRLMNQWAGQRGIPTPPLIVAHTHGHGDHVAGDAQFAAQPWVQEVVGTGQQDVETWWGFQDYPNDVPTFDLGGRVLDVLGTPGHHPSSITLYDRNTQLLLTGDLVYPGHLFVFVQPEWKDFVVSMGRLTSWAAANPVSWVLGCHIEMGDQPGASFPYGAASHPNEHPLQLDPSVLAEIWFEARSMGSLPQCQIFGEFVMHPVFQCGFAWNG